MLSLLSESELRSLLLHVAGYAAAGTGLLFVADVAATLVARQGRATAGVERLVHRSPALVRHLAELTVTGLLALGATRPAAASPTPVRDWLSQTTTTTGAPHSSTTTLAVPAPTTATTAQPTMPTPRAAAARPAPEPRVATPHARTVAPRPLPVYVVRSGDCLWQIAATRLGPGATNRAIDAAWRAVYAANRAAIGEDPNLIHPGLTLTLPPLPETR